ESDNLSRMAILVTGGTGFLGRHVVDLLLASGEEVRVLARTAPDDVPDGPVRHINGSVLEPDVLRAAVAGCRLVIHAAGRVSWSAAPEPARKRGRVRSGA